jgi:sulfite reductase beta subunit-like hemoprotein
MFRITLPGGGPITAKQWNILDRISDSYTIGPENAYPHARPGLKITTRQNIQLHWVKKINVVDAIRDISESGFFTITVVEITHEM